MSNNYGVGLAAGIIIGKKKEQEKIKQLEKEIKQKDNNYAEYVKMYEHKLKKLEKEHQDFVELVAKELNRKVKALEEIRQLECADNCSSNDEGANQPCDCHVLIASEALKGVTKGKEIDKEIRKD